MKYPSQNGGYICLSPGKAINLKNVSFNQLRELITLLTNELDRRIYKKVGKLAQMDLSELKVAKND